MSVRFFCVYTHFLPANRQNSVFYDYFTSKEITFQPSVPKGKFLDTFCVNSYNAALIDFLERKMKKIALLLFSIVFSCLSVYAETKQPEQAKTVPAAEKKAEPAKQLQWAKYPIFTATWEKAHEYCENLEESGFKDWRLPSIDELRSIVQKCPETAAGGKCLISDKNGKLSLNDYSKQDCRGCRRGGFNLPGNGWFWSASQMTGTDHFWVISFKNTRISNANKAVPYNAYCVR